MRIALIADTHLSARTPECVANWHAARRAVGRLGTHLTVNRGDITLDGQTHGDELAFASRLRERWPTEMRCVPGNHGVGDGSGEAPLVGRLLRGYGDIFGPDHWVIKAGIGTCWVRARRRRQRCGRGSRSRPVLRLITRTRRCFCTA
jgi:hypothetical protein